MEIAVSVLEGVTVFKIGGRLDPTTAPDLENAVDTVIAGGSVRLIFDFGDLDYLSSAGLRVILGTLKRVDRGKGRLVLCGLQSYVREIFDVSGFSTLIPIEETIASALRRFAPSQ